MLRIPILLALVVLLAACAGRAPEPPWPLGIPSSSQFSVEWQASPGNQALQSEDEYLQWVARFYEGFGAVSGWLDMTRQVLERVPQPERAYISARLFELGARIGAEWAKDNSLRRVNTRSAAVWRDALLEALAHGELNTYLDRLSVDVDALLGGALDDDAIRFERYYVDEFDC